MLVEGFFIVILYKVVILTSLIICIYWKPTFTSGFTTVERNGVQDLFFPDTRCSDRMIRRSVNLENIIIIIIGWMFRNCELKPILQKCHNSFEHLILYCETLSVWWSLMDGIFSSLLKTIVSSSWGFFIKFSTLYYRDNLKLSCYLSFHV